MSKKCEAIDDLVNSFADELSGGTNTTKLKALYEANHLDEDLSIGFNDYFLLSAFRYITLMKTATGAISLISNEDNVGVQQYKENKNYDHKTFEIRKNNRKHVIQISIQQSGIFKSLLSNEFINNLIWGIDPAQDYADGTQFNKQMESIHFIYTGDDNSGSDEIVILSIQSYTK